MTEDQKLAEALRLHRKGIAKSVIGERIGMDVGDVWKMLARVGVKPAPVASSTAKFNWNGGDPSRADRLLRKF